MSEPGRGQALDRSQVAEAAEALRRLLVKLDAGELTALRQKMRPKGSAIETVRGVGYRFSP